MTTSPGATAPNDTVPFPLFRAIVLADRAVGALAALEAVKAAHPEAATLEVKDVERLWGDTKIRRWADVSPADRKKLVGRCAGKTPCSEATIIGDWGISPQDPDFLAAVAAEKERRATVSAAAKAAALAPKEGARGGDFSTAGDEPEAATTTAPAETPTSRPAPEAAAEAEAPPLPTIRPDAPLAERLAAAKKIVVARPAAPKAGTKAEDGTFPQHEPVAQRLFALLGNPEGDDDKRQALGERLWGELDGGPDVALAIVQASVMVRHNAHPANVGDALWTLVVHTLGITDAEEMATLHGRVVPRVIRLLKGVGYQWYQKPKAEDPAVVALRRQLDEARRAAAKPAAPAKVDPAAVEALRASIRKELEKEMAAKGAAASVASAPASAPAPKPAHVPTPPPATTVQPSAPARKRPWWKFWA